MGVSFMTANAEQARGGLQLLYKYVLGELEHVQNQFNVSDLSPESES